MGVEEHNQNESHKKNKCEICSRVFSNKNLFPIELVRPKIVDFLKESNPSLNPEGFICSTDLRLFRAKYIENLLLHDRGNITHLDKEVLESLENYKLISENINKKFETKLTFGEKVADKVAQFGGSWGFILSFIAFFVVWMLINILFFSSKAFDPYPFILLNLILSCIAALQAPVIMMSQNRQSKKDRLQANEDYCTNLKSELEIQQLHSKLDLFMKQQWENMLEIQQIQLELVEELLHKQKRHKSKE